MKLSIIHPSRQRPDIAKQVYDNWMGKAANPDGIEYILSVDVTDPQRADYSYLFLGAVQIFSPSNMIFADDNLTFCLGHNSSAIEAINNGAKQASGDLFIVVSDDFDCPKNWDVDLLKYLKGKSDFVVKTYDGLQPWIMTLPIMDRVYYERFGYIYYPGYNHMFCDTEMSHVADLLDKAIIVPMTFQHNHYTQPGGLKRDAITTKNDRTWAQGEKLYLERLYRNFDIPEDDIKGVLRCNKEHLSWLKSKGVNFEIV
jgi:hypothetical protein